MQFVNYLNQIIKAIYYIAEFTVLQNCFWNFFDIFLYRVANFVFPLFRLQNISFFL